MAIAKRLDAFGSDPAVETVLGKMDDVYSRTAKLRKLTPGQRRKAERDADRSTVTLDMPEGILAQLRQAAQSEGVSVSGLATLLLQVGLREMAAGRFELFPYKRPTRSPRFEWGLEWVLDQNGENDR